jgi:hypothetical protein
MAFNSSHRYRAAHANLDSNRSSSTSLQNIQTDIRPSTIIAQVSPSSRGSTTTAHDHIVDGPSDTDTVHRSTELVCASEKTISDTGMLVFIII